MSSRGYIAMSALYSNNAPKICRFIPAIMKSFDTLLESPVLEKTSCLVGTWQLSGNRRRLVWAAPSLSCEVASLATDLWLNDPWPFSRSRSCNQWGVQVQVVHWSIGLFPTPMNKAAKGNSLGGQMGRQFHIPSLSAAWGLRGDWVSPLVQCIESWPSSPENLLKENWTKSKQFQGTLNPEISPPSEDTVAKSWFQNMLLLSAHSNLLTVPPVLANNSFNWRKIKWDGAQSKWQGTGTSTRRGECPFSCTIKPDRSQSQGCYMLLLFFCWLNRWCYCYW